MLVRLILITTCILVCRFIMPFVFLWAAGVVTNNLEGVTNNRQNIAAARNGDYKASTKHLIEKLMLFGMTVCLCLFLLIPETGFMLFVVAIALIAVQIMVCCTSIPNSDAYTWILLRRGAKRNKQGGVVYNNNVRGTAQRQPSYSNKRNMGVRQNNGNINRSNDLLVGEIGNNGKRPADGQIQNNKVWSVNGSKKCFITLKGCVIYKGATGNMSSVQCNNISDDSNYPIYELTASNAVVEDIADSASVDVTTKITKSGKIVEKLYITDEGEVLPTPFEDDKYPVIANVINNIVIKMPEKGYYVAENNLQSGMVISNLEQDKAGYTFMSYNNGKLASYLVNEEFELITINGKDSSTDDIRPAVSIRKEFSRTNENLIKSVEKVKTLFEKIPSCASLSMSVKNFTGVKLPGLGKDGVYDDGTVDLMCEFGELMVLEEDSYAPGVQSVVLTKLLPVAAVSDVMQRIGNNWTDDTVNNMIDDVCIVLKGVVESKLAQCINYWFTDDKDVYYMSFVLNGTTELQEDVYSQLYSIGTKMCLRNKLNHDQKIGYRCSVYEADQNKFLEVIPHRQSYFFINPINITPKLFDSYMSEVIDKRDCIREVSDKAGVVFKGSIAGVKRYVNPISSVAGYCCKTKIPKSFLEDWVKSGTVFKIKLKSGNCTPAKLRDALIKSIDNLFLDNLSTVVAICYENDEGDNDINFLYSDGLDNRDDLVTNVFRTPLITYACYDRMNNYLLETNKDTKMSILLFKKAGEKKNEN